MEELTYKSTIPAILKPSHSRLKKLHTALVAADSSRSAQAMKPEWSTRDSYSASRRNRYPDVVPYDKNRIKLVVPNCSARGSDYINASLLHLPGSENYIATQGPRENTIPHFWSMIASHTTDPSIIVMLTPHYEGFIEKCSNYLPTATGETRELIDLDCNTTFSVTMKEQTYVQSAGSTLSKLTLRNGDTVKTVYHILFEDWPDRSIPANGDHFLGLVTLVDALSNEIRSRKSDVELGVAPIVVHCSAGIGRTGTFIAFRYILRNFDKLVVVPSITNGSHVQGMDYDPVYNVVSLLREQRIGMVQDVHQLDFIYECLRLEWTRRFDAHT